MSEVDLSFNEPHLGGKNNLPLSAIPIVHQHPLLSHLERLIWIVLKAAEKRLFRLLTADLTLEHLTRLDGLLVASNGRRGTTKLSWLREPPGVTSAKSVKQIVERLLFLRGLELPVLPATLHQNRVLQFARKCSKYQIQPLLKFKAERRYALLRAHLFELSQDLTDQALDQFDKLLGELMRKGERRQEKHFHLNARKLNSDLTVLTRAAEAFLQARTDGEDPVAAILAQVSEPQLAATVDSAKSLLRPENLDSLDLIESRYTPLRQSLLSLYQALDFQPVRKSEPALQALEYVSRLSAHRKRVTAREQKQGFSQMTERTHIDCEKTVRVSRSLRKKQREAGIFLCYTLSKEVEHHRYKGSLE